MKTIEKIIKGVAVIALLAGMSSCAETITQEEHRAEVANLVEAGENKQDSIERMYISTLDEIDNNLDVIRDKEGLIVMGPKSNNDLGMTKREQILNNIAMINTLLEDNKAKIAKLESSLASYKKGKKEFVNSINQSKERIAAQEKQIEELKALLQEKDFKIAELNKRLSEQEMLAATLIEENTGLKDQNLLLTKDVNRVYFASGTYKELRNKHILQKEGGVLGIGRTKVLNKELDKGQFSEMNKKENTTIALTGKKPKLITQHPLNSYSIVNNDNDMAQLTIKDPDSFWSVSKYLVVETQ